MLLDFASSGCTFYLIVRVFVRIACTLAMVLPIAGDSPGHSSQAEFRAGSQTSISTYVWLENLCCLELAIASMLTRVSLVHVQ